MEKVIKLEIKLDFPGPWRCVQISNALLKGELKFLSGNQMQDIQAWKNLLSQMHNGEGIKITYTLY